MLPLLTSALLLPAGSAAAAPVSAQNTTLVSMHPADLRHADGGDPTISGDGQYVFFTTSEAILPNDLNALSDLYVFDRRLESYDLISHDLNSLAAGISYSYGVSSNGRFAVFSSVSSEIVSGDTNGFNDVFHLDRATGQMTCISLGLGGVPGDGYSMHPSVSNDGQLIAFVSDATNLVARDANGGLDDVYVHHLPSSTTGIISKTLAGEPGNRDCYAPLICGDGSAVVFASDSTNYASGDAGRCRDLFVKHLGTGALKCITTDRFGRVDTESVYEGGIREDGSEVIFSAWDSDFVLVDDNQTTDIFVVDVQSGAAELVSLDRFGGLADGGSGDATFSSDGSKIIFNSFATDLVPSDANGSWDVFVLDRLTGLIVRESLDSGGREWMTSSHALGRGRKMSDDGRFVAFLGSPALAGYSFPNYNGSVLLRDRSGIGLSREGMYPGVVTLRVLGAEPGASLVLLYGPRGPSVAGTGPCAGLRLHLLNPARFQTLTADSLGQAATTVNLNDSHPEAWVQVVSAASCRPSNEVFVDKLEFWLSQSSNSNWCTSFGVVRVNVINAAPNSNVSLFYGMPGATSWPGRHCAGLVLGVSTPTWLSTLPADAVGELEFVFDMPNAHCSMSLQAISHDDCRLSNLLVLR